MPDESVREFTDRAHAIILDIEGTTTSIDFVKDCLFPYAKLFLESYVTSHWEDDEMKEVVQILVKDQEMIQDHEGFISLPQVPSNNSECLAFKNKIIAHLKWQQSKDLKCTGLKRLQGYIWREGYLTREIIGHVYEDVVKVLKYWKGLGKKVFIYSSGSIEAQKLLFRYSEAGDLSEFIDGNFDTTIGSKIEAESYSKIALHIKEKPENIVFFTDRPKEVAAAKLSGMKVIRIVRESKNPYLEGEKEFIGQEDAVLESFSAFYTT